MKQFTETDTKYLAGLIDADGWIGMQYQESKSTGKTYLQMTVGLATSENIDRDGKLIKWLGSIGGRTNSYDYEGGVMNSWTVGKRSELNMLVPRLLKHMIIKGKHLDNMYSIYTENQGKEIPKDLIPGLKEFHKQSRLNTGPAKPKNYPTKAWVAGYLDGDGHYGIHKRKRDNYVRLSIDALAQKSDTIALEYLVKQYGGAIGKPDKQGNRRWYRGLGKQHRDFAIGFLKTMHRHSRLKQHKIEQMLAFHNSSCND